jgi:gluconate 2-dehydrogenase gamma chain
VGFTLSDRDRVVLDAVVARLIPSDDSGPGAREAGVVAYIERSLEEEYVESREVYSAGLAALSAVSFESLATDRQDAVLADMERRRDVFFEVVLRHAIEGMFGDPAWGGNVDRIGWDLLGYPGPRHVWTEADQELGVEPRVEV